MVPELPDTEAFEDHGLDDFELADLWHKLIVELLDTEYSGRTHGNRRTYDAGCKGPLCMKSVREHARRRTAAAGPSERYRYIDPILEYWKPIAMKRIADAQKKILETLVS